jgi:hypothetical protein
MKYTFPKLAFLASIILLIFSCASFYILYNKINDNNDVSSTALSELQLESQKRSNLESLQRFIKDIDDDKENLDSHFIRSGDVVPFLNMVESLAPQVGAKSEVSAVNIGEDNKSLTVGIKATGSFESVYKFLKLLENSPYELQIVSMDLQRTSPLDTADVKVQQPEWSETIEVKLLSFVQ